MTRQHGFSLLEEKAVPELASTARIWRHEQTKSRLLSMGNMDENKVFGVTFRTPPPDSSGVAHILEHSVLCGSKKYPLKEPFVELLKGSLQTFLNAFTYPDKTCYPVASCNLTDFRNLTDVYLDAVFFPKISQAIFQQEGWHFEADAPDDTLRCKGVVYNEMKGAFSSPESVLARHALHALFPDTVYSLESGGDPKVIPSLTYEQFIAFHQNYYHPSNAFFYFWGDDPEEERLLQLNSILSQFSAKTVDSSIAKQTFWNKPRELSLPFAAGQNEKDMCTINWLLGDTADVELTLGLRMLEHILLGMPASFLRRALIESGLGEDLAGQGLETELRQLTFDIGLKGIHEQNAPALEALVFQTLTDLADNGIPQEAVQAAVNSIEFALRENNTGRFPLGLAVMLRALTTWLHDLDPLAPLAFAQPLDAIKKRIDCGESYFEDLLRRYLLKNPHRVRITLQADKNLAEKQEAEEREWLRGVQTGLGEQELFDIIKNTQELQLWQTTPDSKESLASIPRLHPSDLSKKNTLIPSEHCTPNPLFFHPLPTAGIAYVEVFFDLDMVPERLLPLLPLFGRALLEMGTQKNNFMELNMAIAGQTGGMDSDLLFLTHASKAKPLGQMVVSAKAAPDKVNKLFALLIEILTQPHFDQKARFLTMILEEKARHEHSLIPAGHSVAAARLRAGLCRSGWLAEQCNGISALFALWEMSKSVEDDWPAMLQDLQDLFTRIIRLEGCRLNISALPEQRAQLDTEGARLLAALPSRQTNPEQWSFTPPPPLEALILPAQVNYIGKGLNLYDWDYQWHGSAAVISKYLRTAYLWEKIRVQGGAYGCLCSLDRMSGTFCLVSYRDPNVSETLDVFDRLGDWLCKSSITQQELDAAIVGAIGELDTYLLPDAKGSAAFIRDLCGDTPQKRQVLRNEIFASTPDDLRRFGEALRAFPAQGRVCLMGGEAVAQAALKNKYTTHQIL